MRICLISSNIRFDNPADGPNAWEYRRDLFRETLLKHDPDLIATQEGRYDQLKDLAELFPEFEIIDQHRSWIKERMYPTFYLKKNTFEFIASEDLWLSETPDLAGSKSFGSAFPRLMTWAKIQPKNTNTNLLLVDTHLDHIKRETRIEQMKVLSQEVKRNLDTNSKLVIMGDFNDSPDSEVREILTNEFPQLVDSWKKFNQSEETSHHFFNGLCPDGKRIDWIMVDESLEIESSLLDKSSQDGKFPSDHFPMVTVVKL